MKIAGETGAGGHTGVKEATVYSAGLIPCETWATGSEGVDKALWDAEPVFSPRRQRSEEKIDLHSPRAVKKQKERTGPMKRGGPSR